MSVCICGASDSSHLSSSLLLCLFGLAGSGHGAGWCVLIRSPPCPRGGVNSAPLPVTQRCRLTDKGGLSEGQWDTDLTVCQTPAWIKPPASVSVVHRSEVNHLPSSPGFRFFFFFSSFVSEVGPHLHKGSGICMLRRARLHGGSWNGEVEKKKTVSVRIHRRRIRVNTLWGSGGDEDWGRIVIFFILFFLYYLSFIYSFFL